MKFIELKSNTNPNLPLIYLWEIVGYGGEVIYRYVGKAAGGAGRPRKHYQRNVDNLLAGRPYRKNNPSGFREVHHRLADAAWAGHTLRLTFICNIEPHEDINFIERKWQQHYGLV